MFSITTAARNHYFESTKNIVEQIDSVLAETINIESLPISIIKIVASDIGCRAFYHRRAVTLAANSSCFHPNYRGYRYKTFGGIKDLTPAGVFCHEIGHALEEVSDIIHSKFESISRDERRITAYAYTNTSEDIAESTRLYLSNPNLCKINIPFRYEILKLIDDDINFSKYKQENL